FNLGNYEKAIDSYKMSLELGSKLRNGQILWEAYLELANTYIKKGDYYSAIENLKNSINIIENIRSKLVLEEYKYSFLSTNKRLDSYYKLIDILVKIGLRENKISYLRDALLFSEKARARSFLDSIELSKISFEEGISQKLRYYEVELMNEISNLYTKLLNPELTENQKQQLYNKLEEVEQELENIRREMRKNNPAYANLQYPQFITLDEAQKKLISKKTLVLSYLMSSEASYVFALTKDHFKVIPLPPTEEIKRLVRNYLIKISDPESNDFNNGYELYLTLIDPALRHFSGIKRIIIIPDDILHYLPFESISILKNGRNKWLIENFTISYAPSLTSIKEIIERRNDNGKRAKKYLLAIGNPLLEVNGNNSSKNSQVVLKSFYEPGVDVTLDSLRFSTQEVERISSYFPLEKKKVLVAEEAAEERVKEIDLTQYKIIHFATHCIIDDKKPARSSIILKLDQDPQEDGLLQVREIFNLRLNADLVTLSACQTGKGALIRGEGIEGLNRAFFYAGASSLILSLWSVNDQATSQLMQRFYFYLKKRFSVEIALQKAKLELIRSKILSHPFYWAAFIAYGNTQITIIRNNFYPLFFTSAIILALILSIFIKIKNGKSH
ncbi:MAG: CHAT domain-containing protein, partial [Candidatus Aminicenantes bacterium]|nr:CHAT domain-containing protein [Candidatus Aminicenantes bacterium]